MKLFADIKVRLPRSFDKFAHSDATGGIIMLCCIVLALILQNGSYSTSYRHWLDTTAGVVFGDFILMKPLLLWINDGLITVFFFSIGLQLKIEFVEGHLSNPSNIVLPSLAAIAGILLPAFIFFAFNFDDAYAMRGWAIPTSHDTAFSVALLMVLGKRVPNSLKILLLSISVFDDLGSMFIVAVFYNNGLDVYALIPALAAVVAMIILNFFGVGRKSLYIALGVILWFSILKSGVHATSAGIITAFCMPMRSRTGEQVVHEVSDNLALWVSLVILPLFTLANAGVDLGDINISTIFSSVSMGIFLGLVIGKPMGMFSIMYVASRLKLVKLPNDITMIQVYGMCTLTGIGFSMSMFYDSLAYEGSNIYGYADALAILIAALVSGIYGFCFLRFVACKTPMIEYRPWLPAPTGYHGTARTANLYSLEKPVQGPSSVAPTAALVAEANKRNAAAAAAAEAAKKAAEAASKAAEIIKKATEINDANKEKTIAEVQLAAAEAAQAAATVAVTATKLDDSEEHAETAETVETVLKTASQVAEEAKETVAEVTAESAESDADSTDPDASESISDTKSKAKAKTDDAKAAVDDDAATSIDETGAASAAVNTAESSTVSDAVAKSKAKQADAEAAVESESSAAKTSKKSDKEIEVVETVIAVNSSGQAKVEKTVVKTTVEELKSKQQAAINEDSPLNAFDYIADKASTDASQNAAVQTDASDETEASTSSKKAASADTDAKVATSEDSKADTEVDPLAEAIAKADKKAKELEEEHEEDILADLKPVKKPKSKTKYELGEEDDDSTYETIAEHKEVAHQTAKAVVDYLSRIAGKAKVEVSGNIERSDEEKAAARAAAAAKIAAIKAAELESQAQADAAVAEAKAKAAAEAAHKTVEKVEKEAAVKVAAKASEKQSDRTADKQVETTSDKLSDTSATSATESKSNTEVAPKPADESSTKESTTETAHSIDKTEDKSKSFFDPAVLVSGMVAGDKDSDAEESKAKDAQADSQSSKSKAATEELKAEVAREVKLADGETISEEVLESSSDEALAAIAAAESEAAKAEAEAEAAKAKAQEAKEAVAKAAEAARVAAEIAAAKKSEGKQKAKAQHAMEEAQKKASESEDTEHEAKAKDKEETDTLSEVTTTVVDAVSTVASVVAVPAVKAAKIVSATASITASVTAAAVKAAAKVVESKDKDKEKDEYSKDGDTLVKEIITAKDPRFSKQAIADKAQSEAHSDAQTQPSKQAAKDAESATAQATESSPASAPAASARTVAKPSRADEVESQTVAEIASDVSQDAAGKDAQSAETELQPSASDEVDTENLTVKASAVKRKASEQPLEDIDALTLEEVTFKPVGPAPDLEPIASSDAAVADRASPSDTNASKLASAADDVDTENLTVKESVVKSKASAKAVEVDALTVDEVVTAVASGKELDESGYTQKAARLDEPMPHTDISVDESDRCDVQPLAKSDVDNASIEPLMADDYKHANKDYSEPNSVQFNDAEVKDDQGSVKSVVGKLAGIIRKSKD